MGNESAVQDVAGHTGPRLSLCMIVKNEERWLPGCLASIRGCVDEIIIGDTGSDDGTIGIARSYGARVVHIPWTGDFSAARNAVIVEATGDWILALDADERLAEKSAQGLRSLLSDVRASAYLVLIQGDHHLATGLISQVNAYPRLFRRHPAIRYEGLVHEQITPSLRRAGFQVRPSDLVIVHLGYAESLEKVREKCVRNLGILRAQLSGNPADPYIRFQIGNTLAVLEKYDEAARELEPVLSSKTVTPGIRAATHNLLAEIDIRNGRFRAAHEHCIESLKRARHQTIARWYLAASCIGEGAYADAIPPLREILRSHAHGDHGKHPEIAHDIVLAESAVRSRIGLCYEYLRKYGEASAAYRLAVMADPESREAVEAYLRTREALNRPEETVVEIRTLQAQGVMHPHLGIACAKCCRMLGRHAEAYEILSTLPDGGEPAGIIPALLMIWNLLDGDLGAAEEQYRAARAQGASSYEFHRAAVDLALRSGDSRRAIEHLERCAVFPGRDVSAIKQRLEKLKGRLSSAMAPT